MHSSVRNKVYPTDTVGGIMSTNVPKCFSGTSIAAVEKLFSEDTNWDSMRNVYVISRDHKLVGVVEIAQLFREGAKTVDELLMPALHVAHPDEDETVAMYKAVRNNITSIPVVAADKTFLGAVTAKQIIAVMHKEHIEESLTVAGVRSIKRKGATGEQPIERTWMLLSSRLPWLVMGLVASMLLGFVVSLFEEPLQKSIALAFFIPVVTYINSSVGTQAGSVTIRALATMNVKYSRVIVKELLIGLCLGIILGTLGGVGAFFISGSLEVGLVVLCALMSGTFIASGIGTTMPYLFKKLNKDPAVASGPLATAIQDLVSIILYFLFALLILL